MADSHDLPFRTEYAKSNRSSCKLCKLNINKDKLRMAKMIQSRHFDGKMPQWYHFSCFFRIAKPQCVADIAGIGHIRWADQQTIKEKIGGGVGEESTDGPTKSVAGTKRKTGQQTKDGSKKLKKAIDPLEKELQEQSEMIWNIRDELNANLTNSQLKLMLEANEQTVTKSSESKLLECCSDGIVFGGLQPCDVCGGQLVARTHHYTCTGNISDWTKCTVTTTTAKRKRWTIPEELLEDFPFMKKYKMEEKQRVFPKPLPTSAASSSLEGATLTSDNIDSSLPLKGLSVRIIGKLDKTHKELSEDIKKLGGTITTTRSSPSVCISDQKSVDKMDRAMKDIKKNNVPVVTTEFLNDMITNGGNPYNKIAACKISIWSSSSSTPQTKKKWNMFEKISSTVKVKVKGGAVVDPDSGLDSTHHVLDTPPGNLHTVVLGMVDVVRGTNSYYKLQLLESDTGKSYHVFRSWGRVGTIIGGKKTERFPGKNSAINEFERLYLEKTGNEWEDRHNFKKVSGKFFPLEIDYGNDDNDNGESLETAGTNSVLPAEIQQLVKMIFDIESMKKALVEFEIDTKKMPLGKLSRRQLQKAYSILSDLLQEIKGNKTPAKILDGSNQFYTLIPHDFGMEKPPLLQTEEMINTKTLMLDNLMEIELAYSILKTNDKQTQEGKDPLDIHYEKLHTDMEVVPHSSQDYNDIVEYVTNTHASTHSHYSLDVMEVFKISRHGETKRYKPFTKFNNRMLLWHGSRLTNFVGILSQGLRIAPPEAPVTGYMFGKGIYFADMVSKSANYCWTSKNNSIGLMLLCEVALGDMYERTAAEYVTQLPVGKHSTKGLGRTAPDTKSYKTAESGAIIPLGKGCASSANHTSLLYNEYIVYDVAQINMKYLVKMNFKY